MVVTPPTTSRVRLAAERAAAVEKRGVIRPLNSATAATFTRPTVGREAAHPGGARCISASCRRRNAAGGRGDTVSSRLPRIRTRSSVVEPPLAMSAVDDDASRPHARSPGGAATDLDALVATITLDGDRLRADDILPAVYSELRRLAAARLAKERDPRSLTPTVLVHEAYLRVVGRMGGVEPSWNGKGHFFAAAALAMRRILVERARRRRRVENVTTMSNQPAPAGPDDLGSTYGVDLVSLDEALAQLETSDKLKHDIVMARFFAGLTVDDTADLLRISASTVKREWNYARAWLLVRMEGESTSL